METSCDPEDICSEVIGNCSEKSSWCVGEMKLFLLATIYQKALGYWWGRDTGSSDCLQETVVGTGGISLGAGDTLLMVTSPPVRFVPVGIAGPPGHAASFSWSGQSPCVTLATWDGAMPAVCLGIPRGELCILDKGNTRGQHLSLDNQEVDPDSQDRDDEPDFYDEAPLPG
ncbi:hypothetical protein PR048_021686 [Dryococelus australis]|uniref:Uncharacterized protein n=1 Tax=Dryococelus australis TaxID=614101 RepID=A0ABQ9GYW8_9NEOP|nr:hypothetical protein PR048_021686 [Dryococelus australis]